MHMVEIERILVEAGNSVQLVVQVIIFLNRKTIRPGSNKSGVLLSRHFLRENNRLQERHLAVTGGREEAQVIIWNIFSSCRGEELPRVNIHKKEEIDDICSIEM